ncbi:hypothetical protein DDN60_15540 [Vibrio cholerae]|nr:hypothetical protein [Vibrio cholerae]
MTTFLRWFSPKAPPPCPVCGESQMMHRCFSPTPSQPSFSRNGWYCQACKAGPYHLGTISEIECADFSSKVLRSNL